MTIEAPAWIWLVPVWITLIVCGTIILVILLKKCKE